MSTTRRIRIAAIASGAGVAQRSLQIAATLVLMPAVLGALGERDFGVWAAAISCLWVGTLAEFGVGGVLITEVARRLALDDAEGARRQIDVCVQLAACFGAAGLALCGAAAGVVATSASGQAFLIAACCLCVNVPLGLTAAVWQATQRAHVSWGWDAVQMALAFAATMALTIFSRDPRLYVAATAGAMILANMASALHLWRTNPALRPNWRAPSRAEAWRTLRLGLPYFCLSLASALTVSLDAVVALWLLGPEQAAQMALVQRAGMTVIGLLMVSTQSLWPAFTEAVAKGERDWVVKHARGAVALVASLSLAGGVVLVFAGPVLVRAWLGPALPLDRTILAALACWVFVLSIGRIPDLLLNSLGKAWIQVHVSLVFSVVAFGLKLILAPALGVAGIVYATAIAYALTHVPAYLWWMRRWTAPPEGSANVVAA